MSDSVFNQLISEIFNNNDRLPSSSSSLSSSTTTNATTTTSPDIMIEKYNRIKLIVSAFSTFTTNTSSINPIEKIMRLEKSNLHLLISCLIRILLNGISIDTFFTKIIDSIVEKKNINDLEDAILMISKELNVPVNELPNKPKMKGYEFIMERLIVNLLKSRDSYGDDGTTGEFLGEYFKVLYFPMFIKFVEKNFWYGKVEPFAELLRLYKKYGTVNQHRTLTTTIHLSGTQQNVYFVRPMFEDLVQHLEEKYVQRHFPSYVLKALNSEFPPLYFFEMFETNLLKDHIWLKDLDCYLPNLSPLLFENPLDKAYVFLTCFETLCQMGHLKSERLQYIFGVMGEFASKKHTAKDENLREFVRILFTNRDKFGCIENTPGGSTQHLYLRFHDIIQGLYRILTRTYAIHSGYSEYVLSLIQSFKNQVLDYLVATSKESTIEYEFDIFSYSLYIAKYHTSNARSGLLGIENILQGFDLSPVQVGQVIEFVLDQIPNPRSVYYGGHTEKIPFIGRFIQTLVDRYPKEVLQQHSTLLQGILSFMPRDSPPEIVFISKLSGPDGINIVPTTPVPIIPSIILKNIIRMIIDDEKITSCCGKTLNYSWKIRTLPLVSKSFFNWVSDYISNYSFRNIPVISNIPVGSKYCLVQKFPTTEFQFWEFLPYLPRNDWDAILSECTSIIFCNKSNSSHSAICQYVIEKKPMLTNVRHMILVLGRGSLHSEMVEFFKTLFSDCLANNQHLETITFKMNNLKYATNGFSLYSQEEFPYLFELVSEYLPKIKSLKTIELESYPAIEQAQQLAMQIVESNPSSMILKRFRLDLDKDKYINFNEFYSRLEHLDLTLTITESNYQNEVLECLKGKNLRKLVFQSAPFYKLHQYIKMIPLSTTIGTIEFNWNHNRIKGSFPPFSNYYFMFHTLIDQNEQYFHFINQLFKYLNQVSLRKIKFLVINSRQHTVIDLCKYPSIRIGKTANSERIKIIKNNQIRSVCGSFPFEDCTIVGGYNEIDNFPFLSIHTNYNGNEVINLLDKDHCKDILDESSTTNSVYSISCSQNRMIAYSLDHENVNSIGLIQLGHFSINSQDMASGAIKNSRINTNNQLGNNTTVKLSVDGQKLAASSEKGIIHIYDIETGTSIWSYSQPTMPICDISWISSNNNNNNETTNGYTLHNNNIVFGGGAILNNNSNYYNNTGFVRYWDLRESPYHKISNWTEFVECGGVAVSNDQDYLAYALRSGISRCIDLKTNRLLSTFTPTSASTYNYQQKTSIHHRESVCWVPVGHRTIFSTNRSVITIWDTDTGNEILNFNLQPNFDHNRYQLGCSSNGSYLSTNIGYIISISDLTDISIYNDL
eukprot:gene7940-9768_t